MIARTDFWAALLAATALHAGALTLVGPVSGGGGSGAGGEAEVTVTAASPTLQALADAWETPPEAATTTARPLQPDVPPDTNLRPPATDTRPTPSGAPRLDLAAAPDTAPAPAEPPRAETAPTERLTATARPDPRPTREAVTRRVASGAGGRLSAGRQKEDASRRTSAADRAAAEARWAALIQSRIARHQSYPGGTRAEGRVRVAMVILKNGALGEVRVAQSSGASKLDSAAITAVRRAAPFPPAPAALTDDWYAVGQWISFERR